LALVQDKKARCRKPAPGGGFCGRERLFGRDAILRRYLGIIGPKLVIRIPAVDNLDTHILRGAESLDIGLGHVLKLSPASNAITSSTLAGKSSAGCCCCCCCFCC